MNFPSKKFCVLVFPLLLSACSTVSKISDGIIDKDNRPEPTPLSLALIRKTHVPFAHVNTSVRNNGFFYSGALLRRNSIYFSGKNGAVVCIDAAKQNILWQQNLKINFTGSIAVSPDQRYLALGTDSNELYILNAANGNVLWKKTLDGTLFTSAAFYQEYVIVKTNTGNVSAYSLTNSKLAWSFEQTEPAESIKNNNRLVIDGNNVIIAFNSDKIVSLKAATGELNWMTTLNPTERNQSAAIYLTAFASELIISSEHSGLTVMDVRNGRILWQNATMRAHSPVAVDAKRIYLTNDLGYLFAFNRISGKMEWENKQLKGHFLGYPLLAHANLIISDQENYLHCVNLSSGNLTAHFKQSDNLQAEALNYDDNLVFPTSKGQLIFIKNTICASLA